jgi:DNA-binding LacI/PurR family transcriptional regulator
MKINNKKGKRTTIYDIAKEVGIAPSSVSKALNDLPSVSEKIRALVKAKAGELNYKHNSNAASLRSGTSRTIGVIVPKINVAFFSDAIAGMEEACFDNNHRLIICQSDESYAKEVQCIQTLIHQNVDCIIISLSQETRSTEHLFEAKKHHMELVQFDRVDEGFESHRIVNDNSEAAYKAVKHLIAQGYKKIAFFGGSDHLAVYKQRKQGYLRAIKEADLNIPYNYILDNAFRKETALNAAMELLTYKDPPDAFFTVTDYSALGVMKAAASLILQVPDQVGIMGFSNEAFTEFTFPTLSSVDQQSRNLGKAAANVYFDHVLSSHSSDTITDNFEIQVIESSLVIRESSSRKSKA